MHHRLKASFASRCGTTSTCQLYESGSLRLRTLRGAALESVLVNTGGGLVGGDRASIEIDALDGADVVLTSVAAEKVYRADTSATSIEVALSVGEGARVAWLPQETILFDHARLERRVRIEMAGDASFLCCETIQFGRTAFGEASTRGVLRESWRVRRGGRLVHAEESLVDGAIGPRLDRAIVAGGARAMAQLIYSAPDLDGAVDRLDGALDGFRKGGMLVDGGVTGKDGIVLARMLARSAGAVRPCVEALVGACDGFLLPRSWR